MALIRGINVGRAKRVAMADLRALIQDLGYRDAQTLLNSGNIVFHIPAASRANPAPRIEAAMAAKLGVAARVTVLSAAEFLSAVAENPLLEFADDPSRLLVSVLATPEHRTRLAPIAAQKWAPDAFAIGTRVAYLWCATGILASPLALAVNRALGEAVTARNWATMLKLKALVEHGH